MRLENKTAIIIVAFNEPTFIRKQIDCIVRFCRDNTDIIIFDNGKSLSCDVRDGNLYLKHNVLYYKFEGDPYFKGDANNPSNSHAVALNAAFRMYGPLYQNILFLDHDNFPVTEFSVSGMLDGFFIAGLKQQKSKDYYWAGCLAINTELIHRDIVDFSTNPELGLDTGGNTYRLIDNYGALCGFMGELRIRNPYYEGPVYDHYNVITWRGAMFMHFTNGSNWNNQQDNSLRLDSLYRILKEKTGI